MKHYMRKIGFVIALCAALFMVGHIFTHLLPGSEPLLQCQICNSLASISVPAAITLALIFLFICKLILAPVIAVPFYATFHEESRAPPAV